MRAVRLEAIGRLALAEVDVPRPGPRDVLLRVAACGVCGTDRHLLRGEFPSAPPVTLGHEFAGFVEEAGAEVTRLRAGA
jgi:L-iditol 2-dehydrogenase